MSVFGSKLYIKFDASGYVIDGVFYQPGTYTEFQGEEIPDCFLNECYKIVDGEFRLDQDKYDLMYPEGEEHDDPNLPLS